MTMLDKFLHIPQIFVIFNDRLGPGLRDDLFLLMISGTNLIFDGVIDAQHIYQEAYHYLKWPLCSSLNIMLYFKPKCYLLKLVPKGLIENKSALVQVMAWHWTGGKPLPGSMIHFTAHAYMHQPRQPDLNQLTHFPLDRIVTISQTIFSDAFLWMESFAFWLKFHRSLFLRVQLTITQHWFRWWPGAEKATSHYLKFWTNADPIHYIYAAPWGSELNASYGGSVWSILEQK